MPPERSLRHHRLGRTGSSLWVKFGFLVTCPPRFVGHFNRLSRHVLMLLRLETSGKIRTAIVERPDRLRVDNFKLIDLVT